MATLQGIKQKMKDWTPVVQSAFIVYVVPVPSPVPPSQIDHDFTMVRVTSPDDPLLPRLCATERQRAFAEESLREGRWNILVALDPDGEPAGRIWESYGTEHSPISGVPRMKLADDEFFMFDLFVERKYRRSGIAHTMADEFFRKYDPTDPDSTRKRYGYGFVSYENAPSILWHHSIGFEIAQTMNYLSVGPYIKWKIPFSDVPRVGPMSRKGRHTDPSKDNFGRPLFP